MRRRGLMIVMLLLVSCSAALSEVDWRETGKHMRLKDDLDRPQDGWH